MIVAQTVPGGRPEKRFLDFRCQWRKCLSLFGLKAYIDSQDLSRAQTLLFAPMEWGLSLSPAPKVFILLHLVVAVDCPRLQADHRHWSQKRGRR